MINLKERAKKLKIDIPTIYIALKKKETPIVAKILAIITVCYALSPIDLIPDFIPILGYLDDIILLPILIAITIKLIPEDIINKCRLEAESIWNNGKLKKWYYSVPIILIWIGLIFVIIKQIYK